MLAETRDSQQSRPFIEACDRHAAPGGRRAYLDLCLRVLEAGPELCRHEPRSVALTDSRQRLNQRVPGAIVA